MPKAWWSLICVGGTRNQYHSLSIVLFPSSVLAGKCKYWSTCRAVQSGCNLASSVALVTGCTCRLSISMQSCALVAASWPAVEVGQYEMRPVHWPVFGQFASAWRQAPSEREKGNAREGKGRQIKVELGKLSGVYLVLHLEEVHVR